jgi:CheY-like chemotaxis protein
MPRAFRVLYCDDRQQDREAFRTAHVGEFRLEIVGDISEVPRRVGRLKQLPDVVVLDLYHPRDVPDFEVRRREAEARLDELTTAIERAKLAVDKAWTPRALDILEELRAQYTGRALPVMVRTRRGLLLLDDDELRRIESSDAEWLLKDYSPALTRSRMRNFALRLKATSRVQRDLVMTASSTVVGVVTGVVTTLTLG